MTTEDSTDDATSSESLAKLEANLAKIEGLTQRLVNALANKRSVPKDLQGPDQELYVKAATNFWTEMMANPAKMIEHQVGYWGKTVKHFVEAQQELAKGNLVAPPDNTPTDKRFANPLWQTHPYFNFVKQQYMHNVQAVHAAVAEIDGLDDKDRKRLEFFSNQIVDMFSPTNFLATNPDALTLAVETEGQSLLDGLEHLVADLEASGGELQVTLADKSAFRIGENIATTPGDVVFRNNVFVIL